MDGTLPIMVGGGRPVIVTDTITGIIMDIQEDTVRDIMPVRDILRPDRLPTAQGARWRQIIYTVTGRPA